MSEKVEDGKYVAYTYKLYNDVNGDLLFETPKDRPDVMIYGLSPNVVPGLLVAMKGLSAGDKFSVTLPPEAAFGEKYPDNVIKLSKEIFMQDGKLAEAVKVGAMLPMMTEEGFQVQGKVLNIGDEDVEMDFNHPFAGLTVRYDGEVLEVRPATPEEIEAVQHHGCGCGDCGCGDCGDDHGHDSGCCGGGHCSC